MRGNRIGHYQSVGKITVQTAAQDSPETIGVGVPDRWEEKLRPYPKKLRRQIEIG